MEIIRKLRTDNQIFRIKLVWNPHDFQLILIKNSEAFECLIDHDYIKNQSEAVGVKEKQYSANLLSYFCDASNDIQFNLTDNSFTVYRVVNGLKIRYFSSQLNKCDYYSSVDALIDNLSTQNTKLSLELETLKEQNNTLETEKELYKTKLEEFIVLKEKYDKKTMSNFVLLLNEKKKRIQYLNDLLDAFRNGREPKYPKPSAKANSKSKPVDVVEEENAPKKQRLEQISESESDDYNTDDEKSSGKIPEIEPVASTSKAYFNILAEYDESPPEIMVIQEIKNDEVPETSKSIETIENHHSDTKTVEENTEIKTSEISNMITDPESPTLEFNTEDLLDRL